MKSEQMGSDRCDRGGGGGALYQPVGRGVVKRKI